MKHIQTYQQHNEGIKSGLLGAGLAGSMLLGSPDVTAQEKEPIITQTYQSPQDGVLVYKQINTLSKMRKPLSKDERLAAILDEIKDNVYTKDADKYKDLYDKLSEHLENEYGFEFKPEEPKQLSEAEISDLKSKKDEMTLFTILGWLGSVSLAVCGLPQAWMSYKDKHSEGISWAFLLLWGFGEIFALAYVYDKLDLPLILNYAINILIVSVILYYKIKPTASIELTPEIINKEEEMTTESLFDFFKSRRQLKPILKIISELDPEEINFVKEVVGETFVFGEIGEWDLTRYNNGQFLLVHQTKKIDIPQKDLETIWSALEDKFIG